MSTPKRVVVLGGGFGGLEAMVELERRFRRDPSVDLLLVSEHNFFLFTPLLPQIVSSYIEARHIVQSLRDIRRHRRFRVLRARATGIDFTARVIATDVAPVPYDYLVLAAGSASHFFGVPGAAEYAFTLRSLEDAVVLRDHVLDLFEHADHEPSAARKRALLSIVVVGGGYTGVEVVAELRDLIARHVVQRYRGIQADEPRLVLLEATGDLLSGIDPYLASRARRKLDREGIEIRLQTRVTRIAPGRVEVNGNETIDAALVVWTAGVQPCPLVAGLSAQKDRAGRVIVNRHLQLAERPDVFVIGDGAVVEGASPEQSARIAPVALAQGRAAAENIARLLAGKSALTEFSYKPMGMLVSLGMNDAVINLMGFCLAGYFAWLFWNAAHLLKLVGLKKQVQVSLDWSLATFFPRDTSIVRAPRRCRYCKKF